MVATTKNSGTFTAKLPPEPDFNATQVQVYTDPDGKKHFSGTYRANPTDHDHRVFYIITSRDIPNGKHEFPSGPDGIQTVLYSQRVDNVEVTRATIEKGTFTVEFHEGNYKIGFHADLRDRSGKLIDVLGNVDITES
ncbi:hypothetical protein [Pseudomonas sp. S2_E01]